MVTHISAQDAIIAAAHPGTVLVDVRSPAEIASSGTVHGSLCLTALELSRHLTAANTPEAQRLLAARQVIVFCAVGARAKAAAEMLVGKGMKNVHVFNAFRDWVDAGGAVKAA